MKTPLVSVYAKSVDFLLKKEDAYSCGVVQNRSFALGSHFLKKRGFYDQ